MTDFSKILEKAKEVEAKMKESQEKIKQIEVIGISGGDLVKVTLNGEGEMINLEINDEAMKEDKGIIVDLIKAAHTKRKNSIKTKTTDEITKATGGFGIPGFLSGHFELMQNISEINKLIKLISKLPGLGPKSAKRIILKLINNRQELMKPLATNIE